MSLAYNLHNVYYSIIKIFNNIISIHQYEMSVDKMFDSDIR